MAIPMSKVSMCDVTDCSYNKNKGCHTLAITVGSDHAMCDTYFKASNKGGDGDIIAGVGACKISSCKYNSRLECAASGISVGMHSDHADCMTFESK